VNGRIRVAQRFAVDWERLDALGRIYNGPQQALASYAIYGQSALYAVCASAARSIPLKAGERVRRRHVLGKVDNTGNSVASHLHFHAMYGPLPLDANGLPYCIDTFWVTGHAVGTEAFDEAEAKGAPLAMTTAD